MGHHHHGHSHAHDHSSKNISFAFFLNTGFALLELAGGFYTNSVAILSDALHDLGDSLSLGSAWFFERKSKKKRDQVYTYGYKRFSLLGAFINSIVLIIGSIFILREAIERFFYPLRPDATGMLAFAVIGVVVNGVAMLRLRRGHSISERVISLHFLEDVLGWIAVLIGSVLLKFTDWLFIDPLLSVLISLLILFNVYKNLKNVMQIVLQGVPVNVSEAEVRKEFRAIEGVDDIHDLHLWSMDGVYNILTAHVVLAQALSPQQLEALKTDIRERMKKINVHHTTLEFEVKELGCGRGS
jgi:cobalt-zinc-cadmium efflux system protein